MSAVPPSIKPAIGAANDTAEGVIDLAEDIFLFHPKPGGMVDEHRKKRERDKIAAQERAQEAERVEERGYQAVKVTPLSPEVTRCVTFNIVANGSAPILPLNPYRRRATILVITPSIVVTIAQDQGSAISNTGFQLPSNIPIVIESRAQLYAYNPSGFTIQVSVISENYGPE